MVDEKTILIESVRTPKIRSNFGVLADLGEDIADCGLHRPITVWTDGTLISGSRRLRCHFLLSGATGDRRFKFRRIPAVFVDNIEDAAAQLAADNADTLHALPMKMTEIVALWELLKALDEPAAIKRADAARRRGVELRRQAMAGQRRPGRSRGSSSSEDYTLTVIAKPFGMSEATASRLLTVAKIARSDEDPARSDRARQALASLDAGETSIWAEYARLTSGRIAPVSKPKSVKAQESLPVARQLAAWGRALPTMEGLVAGLAELGPPHPDLTWEQVGPVHARLSVMRREMEKMIKKMKEIA